MWSYMRNLSSKALAWITAGIGGFAAIAVAVALGVSEARSPNEIPKLSPGQSLDAGRWQIKPLKVWATDQKIYGLTPKPDQKALVFEVELMNLTAQSDRSYYSAFHLPSEIETTAEKPMVYLARDQALMPSLQPGLPEKLVYVWLVPAAVVPKDEVSVSIEAEKFKPQDNLYGMPGWYNKYNAATVSLPLAGGQG